MKQLTATPADVRDLEKWLRISPETNAAEAIVAIVRIGSAARRGHPLAVKTLAAIRLCCSITRDGRLPVVRTWGQDDEAPGDDFPSHRETERPSSRGTE